MADRSFPVLRGTASDPASDGKVALAGHDAHPRDGPLGADCAREDDEGK